LLRTPQKALPRPADANTTRGGKRNAPSSPDGSDGTIDIEENENKIAEKVAVLEGRVSSLSDRVEYQQDRILQLEQTVEQQKIISKSTNIIIYGIEEHLRDGEVRQLFGGGLDLPSLIPNIVDTYRLGQLKANAARPRPVLVKFNSTRSRNAAFKHSKRLRGRSLSLAEDLTPSQQEARRRLRQISILLKPKAIQCCGEEEPFAFAKQMGESVSGSQDVVAKEERERDETPVRFEHSAESVTSRSVPGLPSSPRRVPLSRTFISGPGSFLPKILHISGPGSFLPLQLPPPLHGSVLAHIRAVITSKTVR
jgi:hypothetical protein